MIPTMLPSGGVVNPYTPFRPDQQTAATIAKTNINRDNYVEEMAKKANSGDNSALEWLINYYATEDSAKTAREWTAKREDTAYQRLILDLQKAGISPYILSGATPSVSSSSGKSYSGSGITSSENNSKTNSRSALTASLAAILALMGIIIKVAI